MPATNYLAPIALIAAVISLPALAADRTHRSSTERQQKANLPAAYGFDYRMKAVAHDAVADTPGYGWRYFSDPAARRAVVISPQGDYYYSSQGKGLRWVAAAQN